MPPATSQNPIPVQALNLAILLLFTFAISPDISAKKADPDDSSQSTAHPQNIEELYNKGVTGDPEAQFALFSIYRSGIGVTQNIEEAKHWLHAAGKNGHPEAQYWLGYIYFTGQGVTRSLPNAIDWYEQSAQQHYMPAEFLLGHIYNGKRYRFYDREPEKAIFWYTRAANHGHALAALILGCKRIYGIDLAVDQEAALRWFTRASMEGESEAYNYFQTGRDTELFELCNRVPRV